MPPPTEGRGAPRKSADEAAADRYKAYIARRIAQNGSSLPKRVCQTDLDVLLSAQRFIREEGQGQDMVYEHALAARWYASLYRQYAIVDLKHYKSGDIALRWRTEDEVLARTGELTCASLRRESDEAVDELLVDVRLTQYQVNFAYEEVGQALSAIVKLNLCSRCGRKLNYRDAQRRSRDEEVRSEHRTRKRRRREDA